MRAELENAEMSASRVSLSRNEADWSAMFVSISSVAASV